MEDRGELEHRLRDARRRNAWPEMWSLRHALGGDALGLGVPELGLRFDCSGSCPACEGTEGHVLLTTTGAWTWEGGVWRGVVLPGSRSYGVTRVTSQDAHRAWVGRGTHAGFRTDTSRSASTSQRMDISVRTSLYRVCVVELASGRVVELGDAAQEVTEIAMDPDERYVAWAYRSAALNPEGYGIAVREMQSEHVFALRDGVAEVCGLGFVSPTRLAVCFEDALHLLDVETGMVAARWSWGSEYIGHALHVDPGSGQCVVSVSVEWDLGSRESWVVDVATGESALYEEGEELPPGVSLPPASVWSVVSSELASGCLDTVQRHFVTEDRSRDRVFTRTTDAGETAMAAAEGDDSVCFVLDEARGWLVCVRAFDFAERARASAPWHGRHLFKASVWCLETRRPLGFLGAWTSNRRHPITLLADRLIAPVTHSDTGASHITLLEFSWDAPSFQSLSRPRAQELAESGPEGHAANLVRWSGDGRVLWRSNFDGAHLDPENAPHLCPLGGTPSRIPGLPEPFHADHVAGDAAGRGWLFSRAETLYHYDTATQTLRSWNLSSTTTSLAIDAAGTRLVAGLSRGELWSDGAILDVPGDGAIDCVHFDPASGWLLVARGAVVSAWREDGTVVTRWDVGATHRARQLALLRSGALLVGTLKGPVLRFAARDERILVSGKEI